MMDNLPRTILKDLVSRYGVSLTMDPLRTEGLLRDMCGASHREIFVLVNAVRQKIPADLLLPRHSLSFSLLKEFLARRLQDELALSDDASQWAVESWADALGLPAGSPASEEENPKIQKEVRYAPPPEQDSVSITRRQQWADDL
jgi:hypothetical protein